MAFKAAGVAMCLVVSLSGLVEAAVDDPAKIIELAVEAYKAEGPEAFIKKAIEGGPMEGNKDALAQASMLRSVETYYGKYESFEIVETVELTSTTRAQYVVFNFENGPMFGSTMVYRTKKGWHLLSFKFHTEPSVVWPGSLLSGCGGSSNPSLQRTAALRASAAELMIR